MPLTVAGQIPAPKPVRLIIEAAGWQPSNKLSNRWVRSEDAYHYTWEQAMAIEHATALLEKNR